MGDLITPTGQRLHVEDEGRGDPVLFLHGWAMSGAILAPLAARVAEGRRAIRHDLRGHGRSDPAPSATLDDHAADLAALVEGLDLRDATVVAWSLGAQVLLHGLPAIRGRLRAAALLAATPRFTAADGWPHGLPARQVEVLAARFARDPARTRARFLADLLAPGEREALGSARLAALDGAMPLPDPGAAAAGLDILAATDLRPRLAGVDLPVLLIHGDADPICPIGASRALADAVPGARLQAVAGAGHAPFLTREDEVASALVAFLEATP